MMNNPPINEGVKIGHVHLRVSNIDRPVECWPRDSEGNLQMVTKHLDLDDLLAQANH